MRSFRLTALCIAIALPSCAQGAFERLTLGGAEAGLAGATVALGPECSGLFHNPAGCAAARGIVVTAAASPALFGIPGLGAMASSVCLGLPWGGTCAAVQVFGREGYRETTASLSCAFAGESGWRAGLRLSFCALSIEGYGSALTALYDAGAQIRCTESLWVGLLLCNAGGARLGKAGEALPRSLECGISFAPPLSGLVLCASAVHDLLSDAEWKAGLSYAPCGGLVVRAGITTDPALVCAGFGVALPPVALDYGVSHHWQLGLTHHVSVSLALGA